MLFALATSEIGSEITPADILKWLQDLGLTRSQICANFKNYGDLREVLHSAMQSKTCRENKRKGAFRGSFLALTSRLNLPSFSSRARGARSAKAPAVDRNLLRCVSLLLATEGL